MSWQGLREPLVFTDFEAHDGEEALRRLGAAMIREGIGAPGYGEALVRRERRFPTGLRLGEINAAIPHTGPQYVLREGLALAILKKPLFFRQMGDEGIHVPVRLIFVLAVRRPGEQAERLGELASLLQDGEFLKSLCAARDADEAARMIREREGRT